jgi:hypothetical protein
LTDIFRIFHPISEEYIFFLAARGTFPKKDHILCHRASPNKTIGINFCILSDHNGTDWKSIARETTEAIQTHRD